jgi:serine/threonine-protein kinase RsbW
MRLGELTIPARAEFVSVARLVVSSVVDERYDLTNDRLDNLKLAISEVCALAIEHHRGAEGEIAISCDTQSEGFDVLVDAGGNDFVETKLVHEDLEVEGASLEGEVGLPFIESLVDEMALEQVDSSDVLRLTLHCEPAEEF